MDTYDTVICRVCKKGFSSILATHLKLHNMSKEDYHKKYPKAPMHSDKRLDQMKESGIKGSKSRLQALKDNPDMMEKQREVGRRSGSMVAKRFKSDPEEARKILDRLERGKQEFKKNNPNFYRENAYKGLEACLKHKTSSLELIIQGILEELGVDFVSQHKIGYYTADFSVPVKNLVIEVQGDYWHGNPLIYEYTGLNKSQEKTVRSDLKKREYYESLGVKVMYIWESDIKNNLLYIKRILKEAVL